MKKLILNIISILITVLINTSLVNSAPTLDNSNKNGNYVNNNLNNNNIKYNEIFSYKNSDENLEEALEKFLRNYYDQYIDKIENEDLLNTLKRSEKNIKSPSDIYDVMQGDQPIATQANINTKSLSPHLVNYSTIMNYTAERNLSLSESEAMRIMRNRNKDNRIEVIKSNILKHMGRGENTSMPKLDDSRYSSINISEFFPIIFNSSIMADQIAEKVRSYYPSCETPQTTDLELNENIMKLNFNFDYIADDKGSHIATASLRLYRLPSENITKSGAQTPDCDYSLSGEDDKLLRVTAYWYTRSARKRKSKQKLCDSKMMSENSQWVELSVRPAAKAGSKGRQLSLGIEVEDQEGNQLKADKYFKGASCTVGTSTPKPIPTMVIDAARKMELHTIHRLPGRNTTETLYSNISLLPIIDICIVEFPHNSTYHKNTLQNLPIDACNLRKMHEQTQKLAEKERIEHLATLQGVLSQTPRHIRHQRQYHDKNHQKHNDPRSKILNQRIVLTREELEKLNLQNFNLSSINR